MPVPLRARPAVLVATLASVAALAALLVSLTASPAAAQVTLARCVGTRDVAMSPGLNDVRRDVTFDTRNTLDACVSLTPPLLTSATSSSLVTAPRSCSDLVGRAATTSVLTWSTGATSTLSYTIDTVFAAGQIVNTQQGTVVAGRFAGASILGVVALVADLTQCATPTGITSTSGPYTLTFLGA